MNRRGFLASLAGGLIAAPTIEEIERLGWKRRFFPGWSPDTLVLQYRFTQPFHVMAGDSVTISLRATLSPEGVLTMTEYITKYLDVSECRFFREQTGTYRMELA